MRTALQTTETNDNEGSLGKQSAAKPLLFVPDFSPENWELSRKFVDILRRLLELAHLGVDWEQCQGDNIEDCSCFLQGVILAPTDAFSAKEQFYELMQREWCIFMSALCITKKRDPLVYQLLLEVFNYGLGEVQYAKPQSNKITLNSLLFKQDLTLYKEELERITVQYPRNGLAWGILALASSWDLKNITNARTHTYRRQCLINMADYQVPEESITLLTNRLFMKGLPGVLVTPDRDRWLENTDPRDIDGKTRIINNWKYSATIETGCIDHIVHWPFSRELLIWNANGLPEVERHMIEEGELSLADLKRFHMEIAKRSSGCCIWLFVAGALPFVVWKFFGLIC